jgi:hypothetical protein
VHGNRLAAAAAAAAGRMTVDEVGIACKLEAVPLLLPVQQVNAAASGGMCRQPELGTSHVHGAWRALCALHA